MNPLNKIPASITLLLYSGYLLLSNTVTAGNYSGNEHGQKEDLTLLSGTVREHGVWPDWPPLRPINYGGHPAAGMLSIAPEFANWTEVVNNVSGRGTFSDPYMSDFSWTTLGSVNSVSIDNSENFANANGFEALYGEADSESNLNPRLNFSSNDPGDPIDSSMDITITFDNPTPCTGWSFCLIDLDSEQAFITATDDNGDPVPRERIVTWFQEVFDASSSGGAGDIPTWDAANAALIGNRSLTGTVVSQLTAFPGDSEAGAAWFTPDISLSSLKIQYEVQGVGDNASIHMYIATLNTTNNPCYTPACELNITSASSTNCTGTGPFTADWSIDFVVSGEPDNTISYQRNSDVVQSHFLAGTTGNLVIPDIPADGGVYDTLAVWFANEVTCGDTVILKRPLPCPTDLGFEAGTICSTISNTEIAGTVFNDSNFDGTMNEIDTTGIQGIMVNLMGPNNNLLATTYTDSNGNYSFVGLSSGSNYRIDFSLPDVVSCTYKVTRAGVDNGTKIQFAQPGECANLGIGDPADYCP